MALIPDLAVQGVQMLLVLALAPLLLGFTRKVKARMLRRRGPPFTTTSPSTMCSGAILRLPGVLRIFLST